MFYGAGEQTVHAGVQAEALRLIKKRDVSYAQASKDLGIHLTQLRSWVKQLADDPQHAFPGHGLMKPEQLEIAQLKREVTRLKADVKFGFVANHRRIWAAEWLCEVLGVSRRGFYTWLTQPRSERSRSEEELGAEVPASDRTYGTKRLWHDLLDEGISCGLHQIERLMGLQALKARPRRRRVPRDLGERQVATVAPNVLDRSSEAPAPNRKWIADFTHVWRAEGWLYVAAVVDLFSRRMVGWSMIWRRGKPVHCCIIPTVAANTPASSSSG